MNFGRRCAIVPYQQSCCKPLYESETGITILTSYKCSCSFIRISYWDALTQTTLCRCANSRGYLNCLFWCFFLFMSPLSLVHTHLQLKSSCWNSWVLSRVMRNINKIYFLHDRLPKKLTAVLQSEIQSSFYVLFNTVFPAGHYIFIRTNSEETSKMKLSGGLAYCTC